MLHYYASIVANIHSTHDSTRVSGYRGFPLIWVPICVPPGDSRISILVRAVESTSKKVPPSSKLSMTPHNAGKDLDDVNHLYQLVPHFEHANLSLAVGGGACIEVALI